MSATISDISRMANVSISTVSHVINGTRKVNEDTAKRVRDAIEETGYIPNVVAKSLKQSNTFSIGLVVADIRNQFFVDVINTIDHEARQEGYQVFVSGTEEDQVREREVIQALCERRVDGIIYSPTYGSELDTVGYLKRVNMPVVMIDRVVGRDFDWVGVENFEGTKDLVRYLASFGHKKIGLLGGFRGINTTEERINGYSEAIRELGLEENNNWIISGNYRNEPLSERIIKIMSQPNHPTAWIAGNNRMVYHVMEAMKSLKLKVPEDVALITFGDAEWTDYFEPRLTTLKQPCVDIGKQAFQLLMRRIKDPEASIQQIKLLPKLEIRDSCGEELTS